MIDHDAHELEKLDALLDSMTREEKTQVLEAVGFSRDQQEAFFDEQRQMILAAVDRVAECQDNVVPIDAAKKRRFPWKATGIFGSGLSLGAAAAAIIIPMATAVPEVLPLVASAASVPPAATGAGTGAAPPRDPVDVLLDQAYLDCGKGLWERCLRELDDAKAINPDEPIDAVRARAIANRELHPRDDTHHEGKKR